MLLSYSSDGTPVTTKKRYRLKTGMGQQVHRERGASKEYLVQQAFIRYITSNREPETTVVIRDPLPLT